MTRGDEGEDDESRDPGLRQATTYLHPDGTFDWDKYEKDLAEWKAKQKAEPVELRPELRQFAEALELRLRENDHKSGWDNMSVDECLSRAHDEQLETLKAMSVPNPSVEGVRAEVEDWANFLFFMWWNCKRYE